jgi:DNA-binding LacI/PurR family transcriptional regulator
VTEAEQIAAALLASAKPPDAIAAMSDQQAAGVVRAARAAGRLIPDDLAVTGWDDAAVAAQLELTTVAQSLRDQGGACAYAALGQKPNSYAMSRSIVRRASTRGQQAKSPLAAAGAIISRLQPSLPG